MSDQELYIEEIPSARISLDSFSPLEGDNRVYDSNETIDAELGEIMKELDGIAVDSIPFNKTDIIFTVVAGIIGAAFDAAAFLGNSSDNFVGKAGEKIHESKNLEHKNQPIDYQGGFDKEGNPILNGSGKHKDISFGGGKHRGRTEGHDLFRRREAIEQIKNGEFRDGGFIDGKYVRVTSEINQNGKPYVKFDTYEEAKEAYRKHMWADFWSTSGLPIPGTSYLTEYCTDENIGKVISFFIKIIKPFAGKIIPMSVYDSLVRFNNADHGHELRTYIQKLYREGLNLRAEVEKGLAFAIPEITIQAYVWAAYSIIPKIKGEQRYSKEAIKQHRHLLLLICHSIVATVNIGIAIGFENPTHLNFVTILRVFKLAFSCIKDEMNYNNRVLAKVEFANVKLRLLEQKTIIAFANGFLETSNYQMFCKDFVHDFNEYLSKREFNAEYLRLLIEEEREEREKDHNRKAEDNDEIEALTNRIKIPVLPEDNLEYLVTNSFVGDQDIENITIAEFCKEA